MGTRSLTVFQEEDGKEIVVMYRQYDGYPSGYGKQLRDFLKNIKIVNGLSGDNERVANGMACLAAQVIAEFKTEAGGIYLHPAGTRDAGEEYIYTLYIKKVPKIGKPGTLGLKVELVGWAKRKNTVLFNGLLRNFDSERAEKKQRKITENV